MWIERLVSSRTNHAIELAAGFAEQRHRVLAENLANVDTPDYQAQTLDARAFQRTLSQALERAAAAGRQRLELRGDAQVSTTADGRLTVRPGSEPAPHVLFHDGTNARLERTLADINENAQYYELATGLLRGRYNGLLSAIRGRVT